MSIDKNQNNPSQLRSAKMTDEEKAALRSACFKMVEKSGSSRSRIVNEHIRLDEDTTHYTTEAEILVFDLPRDDLNKLHVALDCWFDFLDLVSPPNIVDKATYVLIIKARDICPPAIVYGYEIRFKTAHDDPQWFQWFCKEFFDLPLRVSRAFWHKQSFNLDHLVIYEDEKDEKNEDPL